MSPNGIPRPVSDVSVSGGASGDVESAVFFGPFGLEFAPFPFRRWLLLGLYGELPGPLDRGSSVSGGRFPRDLSGMVSVHWLSFEREKHPNSMI
jgi:hypothetical protein